MPNPWQPLSWQELLSVSIDLSVPVISCKWKYTICSVFLQSTPALVPTVAAWAPGKQMLRWRLARRCLLDSGPGIPLLLGGQWRKPTWAEGGVDCGAITPEASVNHVGHSETRMAPSVSGVGLRGGQACIHLCAPVTGIWTAKGKWCDGS